MTTLFVTGSGTDVGKTYVACRLLRALAAAGHRCRVLKPVVSGFDAARPGDSDTAELLNALGEVVTPAAIERVSPWRFAAPLSPDMAAAREGRAVPFDELVERSRATDAGEIVLIEGIGGVMVPLDGQHTVLDWVAALGAPALLVTGSYVGTLSHTLTAAAALAARGVELAGVVVSESDDSEASLDETVASLERFLPHASVVAFPRQAPDAAVTELLSVLRLELRRP